MRLSLLVERSYNVAAFWFCPALSITATVIPWIRRSNRCWVASKLGELSRPQTTVSASQSSRSAIAVAKSNQNAHVESVVCITTLSAIKSTDTGLLFQGLPGWSGSFQSLGCSHLLPRTHVQHVSQFYLYALRSQCDNTADTQSTPIRFYWRMYDRCRMVPYLPDLLNKRRISDFTCTNKSRNGNLACYLSGRQPAPSFELIHCL